VPVRETLVQQVGSSAPGLAGACAQFPSSTIAVRLFFGATIGGL
jgi:hypothetical protein